MVVLYWTRFPGAESCLNRGALERSVENRLGRKVFTSLSDADIVVRGNISRADAIEKWRVWFRMHDATGKLLGERNVVIQAKDCRDVDKATSLVFTLMVESLEETDNERRPTRSQVKSHQVKPETQTWELDVVPAIAGSIGLLPKPVLGLALVTSITVQQLVKSQIAITLPRSVRVSEQNLGANIENWSIDIGACLNTLPPGCFRLEGCAAVGISEFIGAGTGMNMNVRYQAQRWVISAIAGPSLSLRFVNYFFLRMDVFAQVPLRSARFYYDVNNPDDTDAQQRTLWQPWPVIPCIRLGIGVHLP